ncbi:terminase small subunit [Erwinia sp. Leaf53]|uniref:terminase small subunit n=1 Tax=Erwinia sp. Leaf53 TaxID=1736225 RepID=UPI0006F64797|nr:terminase small subunit [Erwinia sp. Leaf53]KQN63641.1 terminase small subunit [Erwinia sp. Leaf53]
MAKPDWASLQQRFLSDNAATGVSPKEWCEAQGLNYASARRYIKKPAAQSAQNPAQEIVRSAQSKRSAKQLTVNDNLTDQQRRFVVEYLKDNNATQAAIRAGYSAASASQLGYQLLQKTSVIDAITEQQTAQMSRVLISADTVLAQMWQLATFDANDLSQYRRGCCRYCWGFGHNYQWRDMVEFDEKHLEAVERKQREPVDAGGYGYDATKAANPDCPRCNGEGLGRTFFPDTRDLPPIARLAYSGTKVGKNGIELNSISRERMFDAVAKRLGLADTEFTQKLQQIEIEKRQLENEKLRKELAADSNNDQPPTPVQIVINAVDARADDGDQPDA